MFRTAAVIAVAVALLAPAAVSAQEGRVEIERVPRGAGSDDVIRVLTNRRMRLGINVDLQPETNDTIGARIEGVTPGGPADKAGLRAGDIITRLDGQPLYSRETAARNDRQPMPGLRLIQLAAKLEPNDTVAVEYLRSGDRRTTRLVTADDPQSFVYRSGEPDAFAFQRMLPKVREGYGAADAPLAYWMFGSSLGRLELAPINPDLGQYFGVTEGVLVIDAPKDSELKLRGGDVVLSVDGRAPSGPQHLLRILRSYEPGESVRLEIQRNRRRETVTGTIEENNMRRREAAPARRPD
jgi:S1-C subfamily serine protease